MKEGKLNFYEFKKIIEIYNLKFNLLVNIQNHHKFKKNKKSFLKHKGLLQVIRSKKNSILIY
jgi:hypothetical protein